MSVVPSIIVLMITALIVFRREITAWAAPGAKQHRWHRTMPSPRPRVTQPSGMTPRAHTHAARWNRHRSCQQDNGGIVAAALVDRWFAAIGNQIPCREFSLA